MSILHRRLLTMLAALLLTACGGNGGTAVPAADFVGDWSAPGVNLSLSADGRIAWRKVDEHGSANSIVAPLESFTVKRFSTGVWPFSASFRVDKPPIRDGSVWRMTIDGVELIRPVDDGAVPKDEV